MATIAALAASIAIGTRLRRWRRSSHDPKLKINPPVVKFAGSDEALQQRAVERRKAAENLHRDAHAVRSGDESARFQKKWKI